MPAFRVSVTRPLDLEQFTDRVAMGSLFVFGAAGYWLGGWPEAVRAGLAAYLTWALTRELDPDHPVSANLAALAGGGLGLAVETHAGVLFVMLLVVKVMVGSSGLPPASWEAGVLGMGSIVFAGTQTGWWAGMAMAAALFLDTQMHPGAPVLHRWIAASVSVGASVFYLFLGDPDSWWWAQVAAVAAAGLILVYGGFRLERRVVLALVAAGLPSAVALGVQVVDLGVGGGSPLAYVLLGGGVLCGVALVTIRSEVESPTDHADHPISSERVAMARWWLAAFVGVAWASAPAVSVAEAVEPAAPLWAVLILVGGRQLMRRTARRNPGKAA